MDKMKLYMAPMEGYTIYVYRNIYRKYFEDMDLYFTPFIACNKKASMSSKELKDVRPQDNKGVPIIPQVISNNAYDCVQTCKRIAEYGYEEVNINCGCPSGTVTSKGRGAGMLKDLDALHRFLEEYYNNTPVKTSIKTRIGWENEDEFENILKVYNEYPLTELIIHPRTRQDFYKNSVHLDAFEMACEISKANVCYNGDINTLEDYIGLKKRFSTLDRVMLGRGLIANPMLSEQIWQYENGDEITDIHSSQSINRMRKFHDALLDEYIDRLSGDLNVLYKMKAFWMYMGENFCTPKQAKKIKKSSKIQEYRAIIDEIL